MSDRSPSPWIFCGNHIDDANGMTIIRSHLCFNRLKPGDLRLMARAPLLLKVAQDLVSGKRSPQDQRADAIRILEEFTPEGDE